MNILKSYILILLPVLSIADSVPAQRTTVKFLVLVEQGTDWVQGPFTAPFRELESNHTDLRLEEEFLVLDRHDEAGTLAALCARVEAGISVIVDFTLASWRGVRDVAELMNIPYIFADVTIFPFIQATSRFLLRRNVNEVALIFNSEREILEALYYTITHPVFRLITVNIRNESDVEMLSRLEPKPQQFVIFGSTDLVQSAYERALAANLVEKDDSWSLVFMDFNSRRFPRELLNKSTALITMDQEYCCEIQGLISDCSCKVVQVAPHWLMSVARQVVGALTDMKSKGIDVSAIKDRKCNVTSQYSLENSRTFRLTSYLKEMNTAHLMKYFKASSKSIEKLAPAPLLRMARYSSGITTNEAWTTSLHGAYAKIEPNVQLPMVKNMYRIGTIESVPWSYMVRDPQTNEILRDSKGHPIWDGYCIQLMKNMSQTDMNFNYEIVPPRTGKFGRRLENGSWDGLVGDLVEGYTDMVFAPLTMTAEREEVVDFVCPFYDQSGIWIVTRKPVQENSLFKFMTVLRLEVWLSIAGALTVTGFMIWILDKYSPYSAQNNKKMYPYETREFTLKESFWFALTSFTPQGGGEAPKALSARILVAAYWLFVVLMLSTFTANLAAFLTVERMKTTVQSLDELVEQERVRYTVARNSSAHRYLINLANAEDELYEMWKNLTLSESTKQSRYHVWDYPIREMYGKVLAASVKEGLADNVSDGIRRVIEKEDGLFAFIHDSTELRYEMSRNCNLTGVGQVFGERPYAIAVKQGSHLQQPIAMQILLLQKDRYFEYLKEKYWNESAIAKCDDHDHSSGISLQSLGGVFIAAIVGLILAVVTMACEVCYYRRKRLAVSDVSGPRRKMNSVTKTLQAFNEHLPPTFISVYPRAEIY